MHITTDMVAAFTPAGRLRAAINVGNPILARIDSLTNEPAGVSVDLAREFARRLGVDIELTVFQAAGKSVEAVTDDQLDVGFFAIDPLRGAGIAFTAPYVLIEGCYLVRDAAPLRHNADVDQPGNRVVVAGGSTYDLYLTRELKHAQLVRVPTSAAVADAFVEQRLEVAAGIKQQLEADARRLPGHRLLDECFMVIQQAMGCPRRRGEVAQAVLSEFVEDMKRSGWVAAALQRHRIEGVSVAPAAQ